METLDTLPKENSASIVVRKQVRRECELCGEPAHFKHTWLLAGARSNPASNAYGRDDCSWCEDDCTYACRSCTAKVRPPDGYGSCSVFGANDRFSHMFLVEDNELITPKDVVDFDALLILVKDVIQKHNQD